MTRPIVTELKRDLEPVTRDPFIDGLANDRPTDAPTTVAPETAPQTPAGSCAPTAKPQPSSRTHRRFVAEQEPLVSSSASSQLRLRALAACAAPDRPSGPDTDVVALVRAARSGNGDARMRSVWRYDRAPRHRPVPSARAGGVDDVLQTTWLRLLEHIERIREPAAIAGWLATTCRRECMRVRGRGAREDLRDDPLLGERAMASDLDASVLWTERRVALTRALATLPGRHRRLMTLLPAEPTLAYRQIAKALAMLVGSIGPIPRPRTQPRTAGALDGHAPHAGLTWRGARRLSPPHRLRGHTKGRQWGPGRGLLRRGGRRIHPAG